MDGKEKTTIMQHQAGHDTGRGELKPADTSSLSGRVFKNPAADDSLDPEEPEITSAQKSVSLFDSVLSGVCMERMLKSDIRRCLRLVSVTGSRVAILTETTVVFTEKQQLKPRSASLLAITPKNIQQQSGVMISKATHLYLASGAVYTVCAGCTILLSDPKLSQKANPNSGLHSLV